MKKYIVTALIALVSLTGHSAEQATGNSAGNYPHTIHDLVEVYTREEVWEMAKDLTFDGPSNPGVDTSTLLGKVVTGYQGWFNAPGDGSHLYWKHYRSELPDRYEVFRPGALSIEYWPDMSELDDDEKYRTGFRKKDGSAAYVFSSRNPKTVSRHFKWMKDYGIHGAVVQRFVFELTESATIHANRNIVLSNCRAAANEHGRSYMVMYDLSLMKSETVDFFIKDWKMLVDSMGITRNPKDKAYQHHNGKPLVAIWGVGFTPEQHKKRAYNLKDCMRMIDFLKNDPKYGGNSVLLGMPTWWRDGTGDANPDPYAKEVYKAADILSPWTVGRYGGVDGALRHAENVWAKDVEWCKKNGLDYLPVCYPGTSEGNLFKGGVTDRISREGGNFLWAQYHGGHKAGAKMFYQAMFDEMDEGTQIFKIDNDPPVDSNLITYGDNPSDHYLWLVGEVGKRLDAGKEIPKNLPKRK